MSAAYRARAASWLAGVILLVATLAGANGLLRSDESAAGPVPAGPPVLPGGVLVIGTADSDPPPVQVGPPALAALATVTQVLVKEGDEVKPGDPLVQFDDGIPRAKVKEAQAELEAAEQDVIRAEIGKQNAAITLRRQEHAVKAAKDDFREADNAYRVGRELVDRRIDSESSFPGSPRLTEEQRERRRNEDLELRKAAVLVLQARNKVIDEEKKLEAAQLLPAEAEATAKQAAAKVERLKATVQEAESAVRACLVRVEEKAVGGVVEHVAVAPGQTVGPTTRGPLLWIIPTGGRVVRAEVEAEFASRIANKVGNKVTVYDHNNFAVTYEGEVRRIGTGFLPKRSASESLVGGQTRVLECLIDVPDPAPPGKPPLRVGQPVRVAFPE